MSACCHHSVFAHKPLFDAHGDYAGRGACLGLPSGFASGPLPGETVLIPEDPCDCAQYQEEE